MTILANILLALVAMATYGSYAMYERAHNDSADLLTLVRADIAHVGTAATSSALAYDAPADIPTGMTAQDYAAYLQNLNTQAAAYAAAHPAAPVAVPTAAVVTPKPAAVVAAATKPVAVTQPKPKATVSIQTQTYTPAPTTNPSIASVSSQQQVYTPPPTPAPTPAPQPVQTQPATPAGRYRDGTYTGSSVDVFYGFVQVQATVSGGNLTDVTFLSYPNDRRQSQQINAYAMPRLVQQALSAQSAQVSGVSGASETTIGFRQSLAAALSQA